jgi:hypothetical protein
MASTHDFVFVMPAPPLPSSTLYSVVGKPVLDTAKDRSFP